MEKNMFLNNLGIKYTCDKSDVHHTFGGLTYLDVYEKFFKQRKDDKLTILELGVKTCSSIKVWKEYFPQAKIVGIDIDDSGICIDNFVFEHGSQDNEEFINTVISKHGPFDIVIDDASHVNTLSIASFNLLRNSINHKGLYIIEDLRNSYENISGAISTWPGMHLNSNIDYDNSKTRSMLDKLFLQIIRDIDYKSSDFFAMHFYSQQVIMEKI
jgi:hypothetical protein